MISPKLPLSLQRIALLWAEELGETHLPEVVAPLISALATGKISPVEERKNWLEDEHMRYLLGHEEFRAYAVLSPAELVMDQAQNWPHFYKSQNPNHPYEISAENPNWDDYDPITDMLEHVLQVEVSRDEFLRWAEEQGYPRPTFWGDEPTTAEQPAPVEKKPAAKKNPRGREPVKTREAVALLRAAVASDSSLRTRRLTEKELQRLCGGVSRDIARKARDAVLGE